MKHVWGVALAVALVFTGFRAAAQTATGNIRGTVVDSSEAVVANVSITLTNASTGQRRTVVTNERGDFDAPFMPPGEYRSPPR